MTKVPVSQTEGFPITKMYESPEQVIVSAGPLVLTHGLGVVPVFLTANLVCKAAEGGFTVGQVIEGPIMENNDVSSVSRGVSIIKDATNLTIRYASAPNVFILVNATTGGRVTATNASWRYVLRAFA